MWMKQGLWIHFHKTLLPIRLQHWMKSLRSDCYNRLMKSLFSKSNGIVFKFQSVEGSVIVFFLNLPEFSTTPPLCSLLYRNSGIKVFWGMSYTYCRGMKSVTLFSATSYRYADEKKNNLFGSQEGDLRF